MEKRKLGASGKTLSAIGLGCMGMSDVYGPADKSESIKTIHAALDAGVTLLDTGDFYGSGHNELLVGEALRGRKRDEVFVAVKFGAMRTPQRGFGGVDCRPSGQPAIVAATRAEVERAGGRADAAAEEDSTECPAAATCGLTTLWVADRSPADHTDVAAAGARRRQHSPLGAVDRP